MASNNTTQKPSPYHHINPRHPRLHKHPKSSSDLLSNSQTAGLVTLNTMTLMPLLLAGAAFAKVSFWTSKKYPYSLFFKFLLAVLGNYSTRVLIEVPTFSTAQGYLIGNLKHRKVSSGHGGYGPPLGYNR